MSARSPALAPKGFRISVSTLVITTLATSVLSLALPVTTLQLYDRILPNHSVGTLSVLVTGIVVVMLLEVVLRLARSYLIGFAGASYVHGLSCSAIEHLLAADLSAGNAATQRIDFHNIAAIRNLKDFHSGFALTIWVELAFVPVFLGLIGYIGGAIVALPIGVLLVFAIVAHSNGRALKRALAKREERDERRYNFLIGSLNASHSAKAFAQEQHLLRRYEDLQASSCGANFEVAGMMTASLNESTMFSQLITVTTVGLGALLVIEGGLSVGGLIAIVLLSGRIMQPMQRGLLLWARYQDFKVSRSKVERIFEAPTVAEETDAALPSRDGLLELIDVSFTGNSDGAPLLNNINLDLRVGEAISITGPQGSGKSMLLKLIAGLHQPSGGKVLVNGLDATKFPPRELNHHVALMTDEGAIFRGTIRDNITRFGDVPVAQAMYVAGLLGMDEEIAKLPAGLQTKLEGNGSDSIPPGLKQRIAIIRVLATRPRILLFDNADRALDMEGYSLLHTLLGHLRQKTATVIVSDDENLRRLADRHYELDNGELYPLSAVVGRTPDGPGYRNVRL